MRLPNQAQWMLPLLGAAIAGASWMLPISWLAPLLSLGLIWLLLRQKRRALRYLTALFYYASGSVGLLRGVAVFFGAHAPVWEGALLWFGSSALLAIGWAFVDRPWKVTLVLLVDAFLPPMAFFDWMSPMAAAGALFPHTGILGWLAFLVTWPLLGRTGLHPAGDPVERMPLEIAPWLTIACICNLVALSAAPEAPAGWKGVPLQVGPAVPNLVQNLQRHERILQETLAQSTGARVLVLPETLETAWAGNLFSLQQAVPPREIWLVGMSVPRKIGLLTDSVVAIRRNGTPQVVFTSAFPVPVSMWHPWSRGSGYVESQNVGYAASWWEPARKIEGIRTWASICYDQLLPFVWTEALLQRPQVVLLTNNEWWAQGTGIPTVQHNTAWAWGRLLGAAEIEAENS